MQDEKSSCSMSKSFLPRPYHQKFDSFAKDYILPLVDVNNDCGLTPEQKRLLEGDVKEIERMLKDPNPVSKYTRLRLSEILSFNIFNNIKICRVSPELFSEMGKLFENYEIHPKDPQLEFMIEYGTNLAGDREGSEPVLIEPASILENQFPHSGGQESK